MGLKLLLEKYKINGQSGVKYWGAWNEPDLQLGRPHFAAEL
jgi:hypothetical protein